MWVLFTSPLQSWVLAEKFLKILTKVYSLFVKPGDAVWAADYGFQSPLTAVLPGGPPEVAEQDLIHGQHDGHWGQEVLTFPAVDVEPLNEGNGPNTSSF